MTTTKLDAGGAALQVGNIAYLMDATLHLDRVMRVEVIDLCPQFKTIVQVRVLQLLTGTAREYFRVGEIVEPSCGQLRILEKAA